VFALPAGHVIATSILLDGRAALRAFFGVGGYPVRGLGVILTFLQPSLDERAWGGQMVVKGATETEVMFARAMDYRYHSVQVLLSNATFNSKFAIRGRTPLQIFLIIHERPE